MSQWTELFSAWKRLAAEAQLPYALVGNALRSQLAHREPLSFLSRLEVAIPAERLRQLIPMAASTPVRLKGASKAILILVPDMLQEADDRRPHTCDGKPAAKAGMDACAMVGPIGRVLLHDLAIDIYAYAVDSDGNAVWRGENLVRMRVPDDSFSPFHTCSFLNSLAWCPRDSRSVEMITSTREATELDCVKGKWVTQA